eukprot:ctg_561.g201
MTRRRPLDPDRALALRLFEEEKAASRRQRTAAVREAHVLEEAPAPVEVPAEPLLEGVDAYLSRRTTSTKATAACRARSPEPMMSPSRSPRDKAARSASACPF